MTSELTSAAWALRSAKGNAVRLWVEGGRLRYRSPAPLSTDMVGLLGMWRGPIITFLADPLLAALSADGPAEEVRDFREERAAILEFDAGFTRQEADFRAGIQGHADGKLKRPADPA